MSGTNLALIALLFLLSANGAISSTQLLLLLALVSTNEWFCGCATATNTTN